MQTVDSLVIQVTSLRSEIHFQQDSLKGLNKALSNAQQVLDRQSDLISGFGTLYTALSGVLAISALLVPIFTYYFAIRPSRKAIKKMKKIIDGRVSNYLEGSKAKYINSQVDLMTGDDIGLRNKAIFDLGSNHEDKLNELQILKLITVFKKLRVQEFSQKFSLFDVISKYPSEMVDEFIKDILQHDPSQIIGQVYRYAINRDFSFFLSSIVQGINRQTQDKKRTFLYHLFSEFIILKFDEVSNFLNNSEFVENLDYKAPIFDDYYGSLFVGYGLGEEYAKSKFFLTKIKPSLGE